MQTLRHTSYYGTCSCTSYLHRQHGLRAVGGQARLSAAGCGCPCMLAREGQAWYINIITQNYIYYLVGCNLMQRKKLLHYKNQPNKKGEEARRHVWYLM